MVCGVKIVKKYADVGMVHCAIIKMETADVMKGGPGISIIYKLTSPRLKKCINLFSSTVVTLHVHPDFME